MKMVVAIVKPFKIDDVRSALERLGVQGLTVTEVRGFGRQNGEAELWHGAGLWPDFLPKTKVEVAVDDGLVDSVIESIKSSAATGRIGDGKIFIYELSRAVRIRTGEINQEALSA